MKRLIILSGLALAACNASPTVSATNASMEEVANKVAAAQASGKFLSPGHWESTVSFDKIDLPGVPAEVAERVKGQLGRNQTTASCLTPEQAAKPQAGFFGGDAGCTYDHFTMAAGALDAKLVCSAEGMKRTMTMAGTYGGDAYHITVDAKGEGAGPAGMTMAMTIDGKRSGACTGKEPAAAAPGAAPRTR